MRISRSKEFIPYSYFEALKVRDEGSNRYPITAIMKISEHFEEYRAEGPWF